ncbi:MAG: polysaccharide pyruvyl transferase family protein [Desulfobacterales bacterium]
MAKRVCIMGASLSTGNMGVTALGTSLVKLIKEASPDAEIAMFIGERSDRPQTARVGGRGVNIQIINYRLSPRGGFRTHLAGLFLAALLYRAVPSSTWRRALLRWNARLSGLQGQDLFGDIWGGDSFGDLYGLQRMLVGTVACLTVHLLGKPLVLLPQTYGPYRSWLARRLAKLVLHRARLILCRDPKGPDAVRALLGMAADGGSIRFCPDVAFALEVEPPGPTAIEPPLGVSKGRPLVGFNVSGLLYSGGYSRDNMFGLSLDYREFVHRAAKRLLEETDCALLFIPHTFAPEGDVESDPCACRRLCDSLGGFPGRVHLLQGSHGPQVLKGAIGKCSFFIGSRMHACIAALSQGIPAAGVAYSDKFLGVFESVGAGDMVIDARRETPAGAVEKLLSLYRRRRETRPCLAFKAARLREQLAEEFASLLEKEVPC